MRGPDADVMEVALEASAKTIDNLKDQGYRIIKPVPESFVRRINGRVAVLVEDEL